MLICSYFALIAKYSSSVTREPMFWSSLIKFARISSFSHLAWLEGKQLSKLTNWIKLQLALVCVCYCNDSLPQGRKFGKKASEVHNNLIVKAKCTDLFLRYNCNRFDENAAVKARTAQEVSRAMLQRYLHYCNRYMNHMQSLKFENKVSLRSW